MTCIVGVLDKEKDCVYIGADSLGSNWSSQAIYKNRKVFKAKDNSNVLMAICGDYKLQNILSTEEGLIDKIVHYENKVNIEHIFRHTTTKIMSLAREFKCTKNIDGYESIEGSILFAYKNRLFEINCNGQVLEPEDEYLVGGSGGNFAIGVLSQNKDKKTVDRITEALEAAEKHGCGVKRPFYIMNTKDDEVIRID